MAFTWHKSITDDGGAIGAEITSGTVGAIFPALTTAERIAGDDKLRKIYITSDADVTAFITLGSTGLYNAGIFPSGGSAEVVGDLTGAEDRYGASEVVSATTTVITVTNNPDWVFFRAGGYLIYSTEVSAISTVTDNGNGTSEVTLSAALPSAPVAFEYVSSAFPIVMTSGTDYPLWRHNKVPSGSARTADYDTIEILAVT